MRQTSWLQWAAEKGREAVEEEGRPLPKDFKPYTVPEGWVPPTMGEQLRYAARRHPYSRYGYALAILVGLIGWGIATEEKKVHPERFPGHQRLAGGDAGSSGAGTAE